MPEPVERPPISGAPLSVILLGDGQPSDRDEVVAAWGRFLDSIKRDHEILLVDAASAGPPPSSESCPALRFVALEANASPGAALRAGIAAARHPLLFYTTANKDFQPNDLQLLLDRIDKVELVTGYRVWRTRPSWLIWLDRVHRLLLRVLLGMSREPRTSWLGWRGLGRRLLARWVFGVHVQDPECPFRLFRRAIFECMPLQCDGPFVHAEVLAKANFLSCWMSAVPVTWLPAAKASPDPAQARRTRAEIIRLFRAPEFRTPASVPVAPSGC